MHRYSLHQIIKNRCYIIGIDLKDIRRNDIFLFSYSYVFYVIEFPFSNAVMMF